VRWDARQLANTLNEFLVRPYIEANYGPQEHYPRVVLRISEAEDLKALTDALAPLIDRGMRVQESELRDRFGLAEPDEGADILRPVSAGMAGDMAMNRERVALNREHSDELAQMVDDALRDWQKTGEAFTNPVLTLAQECDSFDDFLKRLPELQATLNADDFALQLAEVCFKARALGDTGHA
ncbi:TPA: DUF935 family protein, partial [Salmonella enterica]|nr:DUF935 family protein [Salmonella enterica]